MKNKTLFFAVNVAVFFLLLIFVYHVIYSNSLASFKSARENYKALKSANLDLSSFDGMKADIEDRQPAFQETFDKYKDIFVTNDEIIHDYEDKIIESLKNNEVLKFTKSVQYILDDNEMKNISVNLNFNAGYENVYFALFDMEKTSLITSFFMLNNNEVNVECQPILHAPELDEFFMGRSGYIATDKTLSNDDFKKLYDKLITTSQFYIPTWKDLLPVPRNPFVKFVSPEKAKVAKTAAPVKPQGMPAKVKNIYIEGILYEQNAPVCVIGGELYRTGSVYQKDIKIV